MTAMTENSELMRRCLDGEADDVEFARFESRLREDSEFRRDYLRYVNVDMALAERLKFQQKTDVPSHLSSSHRSRWRPWIPAAAAGLEASKAYTQFTLDGLKAGGMTVGRAGDGLVAELKEIGQTMTSEWLEAAGADGQAIVDAFNN